jgi:hypothetical protein
MIGLLSAGTSVAQDYRGRVQGLVTDSSQASVAGATISLRNVNTGVENVQRSNELGQYLFVFVEPGTYTVTGEMAGFSKFSQQSVMVVTRGDVTVNVTLNPGSVSETLNITAQAPELQFNTSTMDVTVDRKMLTDLPIVGRNPSTLALLDPAVVNRQGTDLSPFFQWASSNLDVGGSTSEHNDQTLDGAPLQYSWKGGYMPTMDAVQEFSVQQNSVDAEYGHSAGGILNYSMRSGTNQLHGTAYYFGRNPKLNAVQDSVTHTANLVRNNIWGGSVGLPIRKDKVFTFGAYEQWRIINPYSLLTTLPTPLQRTGNFSQSLNNSGGQLTIYDPWSTQFNPTTSAVVRTPFPGNIIPNNRQDPTALLMMKDIWQPNGPGVDIMGDNNYQVTYPFFAHYVNVSDRTDWNISDKWKIFGRYSYFHTQQGQSNYGNSPAIPWYNGGIMNSLNIAGDAVYTLNPSTVLNFRGGFARLVDSFGPAGASISPSTLASYWPGNAWYTSYLKDLPAIYYPNLTIGTSSFGKGQLYFQHPNNTFFHAGLSKSLGRHYLKIGTEERLRRGNEQRPNLMDFNFTADNTANTFQSPNTKLSGNAYATFLLGVIGSDSQAQYTPLQEAGFNYYSGYIQDDFKVNRKLTLNLGLRYEYESGPRDPQNRLSRYVDLTAPIAGMQSNPPIIPANVTAMMNKPYIYNGAWVFTDSNHRTAWDASKTTLMPRVGMALRIDNKTAVRVGFARYVIPPMLTVDTLGSMLYPGFNALTNPLPVLQGVPQAVLSNPFPASNPLIQPIGKGYGAYTNLGGSASYNAQNLVTGVNDRINISVQRSLPLGVVVDVTGFANLGHNLPYSKSLDLPDPQLSYTYKGLVAQSVANPFYNYQTPATFPGQLRNQATVTVLSLLDQYPQYQSITEANAAGVRDRYYALQIKVKREFRSGLFFQVAYNYNQERTSAFYNAIDQYANNLTYQPSNNPRNRLTIAGTYEIPFGKDRRFLAHANPIVNGVLGGWEVTSLLGANSGDYLRFGQMIATGDPTLSNPTRSRWFNTSMFSPMLAYTPQTNPWQYPDLTGPKYWNLDSTLSKFFPIGERIKLQFKMEVYNLTNHFVPNDPNVTVTSSLFGSTTDQVNIGRQMQYNMKIIF